MSKSAPHDNPPERLKDMQLAFAGHLRDPDRVSAPSDVEDRRMAIYRRLFFNNIHALISSSYPVLKSLYSDEEWRQLAREFYVEHRARSPLFPEVPREFLRYIQEQRKSREGDPPFMLELAHYQWVSVALKIDATELEDVDANPQGDLLDESPVLSPLAWPVSYNYPVHLICEDFQPEAPTEEATHLLVYRRGDDTVGFMQINPVSRLLIDQMKACEESGSRPSGREMLNAVGKAIGRDQPDALAEVGRDLLAGWRAKDIVLGTRPATA